MNLPPPVMWGCRNKWTRKALLLLEAFQIYEDSLCGSCAQSAFHALDGMNTREFGVDTVTCLGCQVRASWHDQHGDEKRPLGEKLFVVNSMGRKAV